jgi:hypothetical protein
MKSSHSRGRRSKSENEEIIESSSEENEEIEAIECGVINGGG